MTITIPVWLLWFSAGLFAGWVSMFVFLFWLSRLGKGREEREDGIRES